jgi:hypothetical protein
MSFEEFRIHASCLASDRSFRQVESATHPLLRQVTSLPLSLVVAGISLPPPRFAAATRPDAPSNASSHRF